MARLEPNEAVQSARDRVDENQSVRLSHFQIWFLAYQLKSRGLIFTLACPAQAFIIITWRDRVIYHEHFCTFFNDNFISPFLLWAESRAPTSCTHTHPHTLFSLFSLIPSSGAHAPPTKKAAGDEFARVLSLALFKTSENTLEQFKNARKSIKGLIPILSLCCGSLLCSAHTAGVVKSGRRAFLRTPPPALRH